MYCPRCATQNLDDAKFCRSCGADISLVPQVLTGELAERLAAEESGGGGRPHRQRRREKEPPTIDHGVRKVFMGVAFLLVSLAVLFFARQNWWFWLLIPSLFAFGDGIGTIVRVRQDQKRLAPPPPQFVAPQTGLGQPPRPSALPPRDTGELVQPPPSVTEATTRHLGIPSDRAPKDV